MSDTHRVLVVSNESTTLIVDASSDRLLINNMGLQGPGGDSSDLFQYYHDQASASTTWTINHNLGKHPNVTTVDSTGRVIVGTVDYATLNRVIVTHTSSYAGTGICT